MFVSRNGVRHVNLPANGLLPEESPRGAPNHFARTLRGPGQDPSPKILTRQAVAGLHLRPRPFHRPFAGSLFAHLPLVIFQIARLDYLGNRRFQFGPHA